MEKKSRGVVEKSSSPIMDGAPLWVMMHLTPDISDSKDVRWGDNHLDAEISPEMEMCDDGRLLDLHIFQACQEPLLSPEEEIELAKAIELGRWAQGKIEGTIKTKKPNDFTQADLPVNGMDYKGLVEQGHRAWQRFVNANTLLVVDIAGRKALEHEDVREVIQWGYNGIFKALDYFDWRKGNRFVTLAYELVEQAILKGRSTDSSSHIIKVPQAMRGQLKPLMRVWNAFVQEHKREPTVEELARLSHHDPYTVRGLMRSERKHLSIETSYEGMKAVGVLAQPGTENGLEPEIAKESYLQDQLPKLRRNIMVLSQREATVIRLRYGLDGEEVMTLEAIGQEWGVTREGVRQIEERALRKLAVGLEE